MFLATTDFTGKYQISNGASAQDAKIDDYIADDQEKFLIDLLGCDLYALFIADLVNDVPQTQRFIDIFNSFCIDYPVGSGTKRRSKGIKLMLKGFTYFNIVRDSDFFNTISGNVKNNFSNSSAVSGSQMGLSERYNIAVGSYWAIQWFICDNAATYPEFNGIFKDVITSYSN